MAHCGFINRFSRRDKFNPKTFALGIDCIPQYMQINWIIPMANPKTLLDEKNVSEIQVK
jgi:hypothetical protein